jgi:RNA polymerase sigma factor (sigma-70 family)
VDKKMCDLIIETYYDDVRNFCIAHMGQCAAADDCTQETFLIFLCKHDKLRVTDQLLGWLYRTALNVIKNYKRKNIKSSGEDIDAMAEVLESPSPDFLPDPLTVIRENLNSDDAQLLINYIMCAGTQQRHQLAEDNGLSVAALYKRMSRIKEKLMSSIV